jgi:outer membrane protein assembly factor BamD (BamD/ComL family)
MIRWFGLTFFVFLLDSPGFAQGLPSDDVELGEEEEEEEEEIDEDLEVDVEDVEDEVNEGPEELIDVPTQENLTESPDESGDSEYLRTDNSMSPEDAQYLQEGFTRYRNRLEEFANIAQTIVEEREFEEQKRIDQQYDAKIEELEKEKQKAEDDVRVEIEYFTNKYPDRPESAELMVQLGNIYFVETNNLITEEDTKDYSRSVELYRRVVHSFPESQIADVASYMLAYIYNDPQAEQMDTEKAEIYFRKILDDYPQSKYVAKASLQLGKYYLEEGMNGDDDKARLENLKTATTFFQLTFDKSTAPENEWEEGLYFLAHAKYNQGGRDLDVLKESLELHTELLNYSERKLLDYGSNPLFQEEALDVSVFSIVYVYKEMGLDDDQTLSEYIESLYQDKLYEYDYVRSIFEKAADRQENNYSDYDSAVAIRERMLAIWPDHPENPRVHQQIALAYEIQGLMEDANKTRGLFVDLYGPTTTWWNANNKDPKAQDVALSILDAMMKQVAVDLFSSAFESENEATLIKSIETFQKYLVQFPFSDDYYNMQWDLTLALIEAERFQEAIKELTQLQKSKKNHPYGGMAEIQIFQNYQQLVSIELDGDFSKRPESAVVEKTEKIPPSEDYPEGEMLVYALSPLIKEYIAQYTGLDSVDFEKERVKITEFVDKQKQKAEDENDSFLKEKILERIALWEESETGVFDTLNSFEDFVKQSKKEGLKSIGFLYYNHNHLEEARVWFSKIITEDRFSEDAQNAARDIIGTYQRVGDWESIRETAKRYLKKMIAPGEEDSDFAKELKQYGAEANWMIANTVRQTAEQLVQAQRREESSAAFADAAQRFELFYKEFESSEYSSEALRLAAICFEKAGQTERSAELFKEFIQKFPKHENAPVYMWQIADSYMSILEFDKALEYYDLLYKRTRKDPSKKDLTKAALQNKPVLKIGIGDYEGAARGFEEYSKTLSGSEKEEAFFQAARYWELLTDSEKNWSKLSYFKRYKSQFGTQNPGHAMEIQHRLLELKKKIYPKEVKLETNNLEKLYDKFLAKKTSDELVHKYGAPTKLRYMDEELDKVKKLKFVDPDKTGGFQKNLQEMPKSKDLLDKELLPYCKNFLKMVTVGKVIRDKDTLIASLYCEGKAVMDVLSFRETFEYPEKFEQLEEALEDDDLNPQTRAKLEATLEQIEKIRNGLANENEQLRTYATTQLKAGLDLSEKENFWSPWHTKIKALLHKRDSNLYPPDADEVLFFEETEVMDPLLPFSPVGGLYGTETDSLEQTQDPTELQNEREDSEEQVGEEAENSGNEEVENEAEDSGNEESEEDVEEESESEESEEDAEEDAEEDSEEEGEE